jgi:hypothetical protein
MPSGVLGIFISKGHFAVLSVLWLLNNLLVLAYFSADHLLVALFLPALVWLGVTAPIEQQPDQSETAVMHDN